MLDIKSEARTPEEGGPQEKKVDSDENSLARSRVQQKSHLDAIRDLSELLRLNERALASLRETEAEIRHIRAAVYVLLAAVWREDRS
jgi:hypothetical protein